MKKRLQGILIGMLATLLLTGGLVHAKDLSEKAQIFFRDIKIYIDGAEIVPKGSDGSVVEPFIMNGATYLPVRAIAEALGKDVAWDGKTSTVYIGKKDQLQPDNYLDRIQYSNVLFGEWYNDLWKINGRITDTNNKDYMSGMLFYNSAGNDIYNIKGDADEVDIKISYPLNSQYESLRGKIVLPRDIKTNELDLNDLDNEKVNVYFYGDDELIYKATAVSQSMPFVFDLDIRGVNSLTIKLGMGTQTYVALTDLALYE